MIEYPPYSTDLAPAEFVLFPKVKRLLAGLHLYDDEVKTAWDGFSGSISDEDWMGAFVAWMHRIEKCIQKDGNFVKI